MLCAGRGSFKHAGLEIERNMSFGAIWATTFLSTVALARTAAPSEIGLSAASPSLPPAPQTLAPFAPIIATSAPIIENPISNAPASDNTNSPIVGSQTTSAPTANSPGTVAPTANTPTTGAPTTSEPSEAPVPTKSPISSPSSQPSYSAIPSFVPSYEPTDFPTSSHQPSIVPTKSAEPSNPPSTRPTPAPVSTPSGSPSTNITLTVKRKCTQILQVEKEEEFTEIEVGIFELVMESYTGEFGHFVSEPQIETTCELTKQTSGGRRRVLSTPRKLQTNQQKFLLIVEYTMQYESRFGYDVENYPRQFQTFINDNLEQVTADMASRFLPVIEAREVIVYNTDEPTVSPTKAKGNAPTAGPSSAPTNRPTASPTVSQIFSEAPSPKPTEPPFEFVDDDKKKSTVALAAGLSCGAIAVLVLVWFLRRRNQQQKENVTSGGRGPQPGHSSLEDGHGARVDEPLRRAYGSANGGSQHARNDSYPPEDNGGSTSPHGGQGTIVDSMFSNPSMVSEGGSLSSHLDENFEIVPLDTRGLQDEFDDYKNKDLEKIREGVEQSVYGTEGMMSYAMSQALMEDEEQDAKYLWGGAEDPESIEANALCETNDWLRKNEKSTLDERNQFFQEILNRMVISTRSANISPLDGTRAIHCCAAMLGLQLEKDLPNNVILVHGMRKTHDLLQGRTYLKNTFSKYGDIEGAAIAPSNRGFGFVRFVSPKPAQRVLEQSRTEEIEVRDVAVMIKPLKADVSAF